MGAGCARVLAVRLLARGCRDMLVSGVGMGRHEQLVGARCGWAGKQAACQQAKGVGPCWCCCRLRHMAAELAMGWAAAANPAELVVRHL